jgi:hypothetical protein
VGGELYHPDTSTEPSLGSFAALGRVLRDKIAARARNIETLLRRAFHRVDATGCGKVAPHGPAQLCCAATHDKIPHAHIYIHENGARRTDRTALVQITPREAQEVLGRHGLHVSREDLALIAGAFEVVTGLGRIAVLHYCSSTLHQTH